VASQFSFSDLALTNQRSHAFVQHPVPVLPLLPEAAAAAAAEAAKPLVLMLTKRERKKLRRQTREERHRLIQDQVRMGLLPAPEPKVRIANMMRVLKDAAVADPSMVEARVRAETAKRVREAAERNAVLKLTPEEREARWRKKVSEHGAAGPECAVFRLGDAWAADKQARFKVDMNCKELYLSGLALAVRATEPLLGGLPMALLFVEGGRRGVAKFCALALRRINWNRLAQEAAEEAAGDEEDDDDDEDSDEDDEDEGGAGGAGGGGGRGKRSGLRGKGAGPGGQCELVWRGTVPRRFFQDFRFEECKSSAAARRVLEGKGLAHFMDVVMASARVAAAGGGGGGGGEEGEGDGGDAMGIEDAFALGGGAESLGEREAALLTAGFVKAAAGVAADDEGDDDGDGAGDGGADGPEAAATSAAAPKATA